MLTLLAKPVTVVFALLARAITAVRAIGFRKRFLRTQCIYYANHCSHGDFILIWTVLPPGLRSMTRPVAGADYWRKSALRHFIGRDVFNAVLIERDQNIRHSNPITLMVEAISEGSSLILFPEGTRNQTDEPLLPFKGGFFRLAQACPQVDFVPVWINNLNRVMPKGAILPVPIMCTVTFGEALRLMDGETRQNFLDRTRAALLALSPAKGNPCS